MIRRPPRSTLFPTRRSSDLTPVRCACTPPCGTAFSPFSKRDSRISSDATGAPTTDGAACRATMRSEEHTSELQSRLHLVCRLLLEKKKKKKYQNNELPRKIS